MSISPYKSYGVNAMKKGKGGRSPPFPFFLHFVFFSLSVQSMVILGFYCGCFAFQSVRISICGFRGVVGAVNVNAWAVLSGRSVRPVRVKSSERGGTSRQMSYPAG